MTDHFRLRFDIEFRIIQQNEINHILLLDHLQLTDRSLVFPPQMSGFLQLLLQGTSIQSMREQLAQANDLFISEEEIKNLFELFDQYYLFDNDNFYSQLRLHTLEFRKTGIRKTAHQNAVDLTSLKSLHDQAEKIQISHENSGLSGLIIPHIDYQRGFNVYRECLATLAQYPATYDLVIILGTDHYSGSAYPILTKTNYQTPNGTYQTPTELVEQLNNSIPEVDLLEQELRHQFEHSIEIGLNVLSGLIPADSVQVLPILAGSADTFSPSTNDPLEINTDLQSFKQVLQEIAHQQKTLVIAAADLCHVGPAFGGAFQDEKAKSNIRKYDEKLLGLVSSKKSDEFLDFIVSNHNENNVCGVAPIYYALGLLDGADGNQLAYEHCIADDHGTSIVSIAGIAYQTPE